MTVLALIFTLFLSAAPAPLTADIAWVASGEFCEPETVLPLPNDTLLVSNVCGFSETENGFLSLLEADGTVIDWRIVDDLDSPLGMALSHGQLYVVDNNQVVVYAWPGFKKLLTIDLPTTVANDIAVADDGTLFVTDSAQHRVIRQPPNEMAATFVSEFHFANANGIQLFGNGLYVGGERLWRVDLETEFIETIGPEWLADIDGIEFEADGTLQVTPVGGPLIRYRNNDDIEVYAGDGVSSANHGYAPALGLALIPTGYDNTVIAIRLPPAARATSATTPPPAPD